MSENAVELFSLILNDVNLTTQKAGFLNERKLLLRQLEERESFISKARKLFVLEKLKYDDYSEIKKEYQANTACLKKELHTIIEKLRNIDEQSKLKNRSILDIFHGFPDLALPDKKYIISMIPPTHIDYKTGNVCLTVNSTLSKIIVPKK